MTKQFQIRILLKTFNVKFIGNSIYDVCHKILDSIQITVTIQLVMKQNNNNKNKHNYINI